MNGVVADKLQNISDLADVAFEQAARKVVERARQTGTPVVVWEDDHVMEVMPDMIAGEQSRKTRKKGAADEEEDNRESHELNE